MFKRKNKLRIPKEGRIKDLEKKPAGGEKILSRRVKINRIELLKWWT